MAKKIKTTGKVDNVKIRMYCLGTGDCFIIKFCKGITVQYTMMIDCGSCQGTPKDFLPYIEDLAAYVKNHVDLLVVTHEHNDHVNGFAKCENVFKDPAFTIDEAWFAWTENPKDPGGKAAELQAKRQKMKLALNNAIAEYKKTALAFSKKKSDDYFKPAIIGSHNAFLNGLNGIAGINLAGEGDGGNSLPGMVKIKAILKTKKTKISYLEPGDIATVDRLPDFKFNVLGPPADRNYIFKDGKVGTDVYRKNMDESAMSVSSFSNLANKDSSDRDLPFDGKFIVNDSSPTLLASITRSQQATETIYSTTVAAYDDPEQAWRRIDTDWLNSAGSLALRLDSHINNTSLALAIEEVNTEKVLLFPGDAEYGSWESWHEIAKWKKKGKDKKNLAEDLLNRTVFYKVGHHLSYNGTALEKGIMMMDSEKLAAMATLDRHRIASGWKTTMPNELLMQELIKRCRGNFFIMDEFDITDGPSSVNNPSSLSKKIYETGKSKDGKTVLYKQYTVMI